jgi:hypothetical protein
LTFNGLHGIISQKIELFISTAVRTSNPIYTYTIAADLGTIASYVQRPQIYVSSPQYTAEIKYTNM